MASLASSSLGLYTIIMQSRASASVRQAVTHVALRLANTDVVSPWQISLLFSCACSMDDQP